MRGFVLTLGSALMLAAGTAAAQAQAGKLVTGSMTGSITAVTSSSITISADGKDMTFVIDSDTDVIARGGTTKTREAQAGGKGVTATALLKTGQAVEIRYEGHRALSIREVSTVTSGDKPPMTASGVVASITGSSLTVKGASAEWTFTVDEQTTVSGTGIGTQARKLMMKGKESTLKDFLAEGDSVDVTYKDMNGTKRASLIRITRRKM